MGFIFKFRKRLANFTLLEKLFGKAPCFSGFPPIVTSLTPTLSSSPLRYRHHVPGILYAFELLKHCLNETFFLCSCLVSASVAHSTGKENRIVSLPKSSPSSSFAMKSRSAACRTSVSSTWHSSRPSWGHRRPRRLSCLRKLVGFCFLFLCAIVLSIKNAAKKKDLLVLKRRAFWEPPLFCSCRLYVPLSAGVFYELGPVSIALSNRQLKFFHLIQLRISLLCEELCPSGCHIRIQRTRNPTVHVLG